MLQVELICGKKNNQPGDFYNLNDVTWGAFADSILYGGGVLDVKSFEPTLYNGEVRIAPGYAYVQNSLYTFGANVPPFWIVRNTEIITLDVPLNTSNDARYDTVVLIVNQRSTSSVSDPDATAIVEVKYIAGDTTLGRSYTYDELKNLSFLNGKDFIRLAKVVVPGNSSTPTNISDWRIPLGALPGAPISADKNWLMGGNMKNAHWAWDATDWSKVTITTDKEFKLQTDAGETVTMATGKIYTTENGELSPMFPGTKAVVGGRAHKLSGEGLVVARFYGVNGGTKTQLVSKSLYLGGDSSNEVIYWQMPVQLVAGYDSYELSFTIDGQGEIYISDLKMEIGNILTKYMPRPTDTDDVFYTIAAWGTTPASETETYNVYSVIASRPDKNRVFDAQIELKTRQSSGSGYVWASLKSLHRDGVWRNIKTAELSPSTPRKFPTNFVNMDKDGNVVITHAVGGGAELSDINYHLVLYKIRKYI